MLRLIALAWGPEEAERASRRVAGGQVCPIDLAAQNGVPELMRALIENGARVTGRDGEGALRV